MATDDGRALIATGLVALWLASADAADVSSQESASVTPDFFDVNKFRAEPDDPGAIHIPGTNVSLFIGGFAWLDVIGDINTIGSPDQLIASSVGSHVVSWSTGTWISELASAGSGETVAESGTGLRGDFAGKDGGVKLGG
ncbi:MAG TPA: hypothetical protein VLT83_07585 [Opitutaceae bacterium]|nr:hypothetical protein [Opitutaceae bacterium]